MLINVKDDIIKGGEFISVGVTWVDGRAIFKHNKKHSKCWYGICHYSKGVFMLTPLDFSKPNMLASIELYLEVGICERAFTCLYFSCKFNRFNKINFIQEFNGIGFFSLALPNNVGQEPLWFNAGKYKTFWSKFILGIDGGRVQFNESKINEIGE